MEDKNKRKNKKARRLNFHKGRQSRNPSQTNGTPKIQIHSGTAIPKLAVLSKKYLGVNDPMGFLTDIRLAIGLPDSKGASKYGEVTIPNKNGQILHASLRVTNHQANAEQYIIHNANLDYNLSIVVRRKWRRNTFVPHDDVKLDEYVYYGRSIASGKDTLTKIINSIIEFLKSGVYVDTTGVALKNTSPVKKQK
ncbi:MAG: hypothetical protein IKP46_04655 [Bacteroidales bacterium]|nr:hypothetical protein [Bacteroidales bacterium]